jgi:hypothetical protein
MDPMVMGNQRTEKSEELRLLYYLRIYGNIGYPAQPELTWRKRRLPSPTRINLEEP